MKFKWDPKCEDSFQILKEMLSIAPILKIAYPKGNCVVCIDACKKC